MAASRRDNDVGPGRARRAAAVEARRAVGREKLGLEWIQKKFIVLHESKTVEGGGKITQKMYRFSGEDVHSLLLVAGLI